AEVDRLSEGEIVGMKYAAASVGQCVAAEQLHQRGLDVASEMIRLNLDTCFDLERNECRAVDVKVMTGRAEWLDEPAYLVRKRRVDRQPPQPIDRKQHCPPAPGPPESGSGALHLRMALRHRLVVLRRDRACLCAEREWCLVTDFGDAFRLDATLRRQRIANVPDRGIGGNRVAGFFGAHVCARCAARGVSWEQGRSRGWHW